MSLTPLYGFVSLAYFLGVGDHIYVGVFSGWKNNCEKNDLPDLETFFESSNGFTTNRRFGPSEKLPKSVQKTYGSNIGHSRYIYISHTGSINSSKLYNTAYPHLKYQFASYQFYFLSLELRILVGKFL